MDFVTTNFSRNYTRSENRISTSLNFGQIVSDAKSGFANLLNLKKMLSISVKNIRLVL